MQELRRWKKILGIAVIGAFGVFAGPAAAHAGVALKQVQISNGSQIDLLFDGKIQKSQIRTEFLNDIIQLSIQDVSVYPAKISSVNGGALTKIFAYQYAPNLVRCRLTVKGKAEEYKNRLEIKANGRILTLRMQSPAAAPAAAAAEPDSEERALLERVKAATIFNTAPPAPGAVAAKKPVNDQIRLSAAAPSAAPAPSTIANTEDLPIHLTGETGSPKLGGARALPSPLKVFGKMGLVLAIFGLFAFGLKHYARSRTTARLGDTGLLASAAEKGGWLSTLGRIAKKGLGREGRMIEVLSTHYLGPKKSIAVVRVADRVLVLGVSNESINLITQLSGEDLAAAESGALGADALDLGELAVSAVKQQQHTQPASRAQAGPAAHMSGASAAGKAIFADLLRAERGKPAFANPSGPSAYGARPAQAPQGNNGPNVRSQIRNRLEGLKQL